MNSIIAMNHSLRYQQELEPITGPLQPDFAEREVARLVKAANWLRHTNRRKARALLAEARWWRNGIPVDEAERQTAESSRILEWLPVGEQVATATRIVRAVIVTGADAKGNEYAYTEHNGGWFDLYNEIAVDRLDLTPDAYARFNLDGEELKLSGSQWVAFGCPATLEADMVAEILTARGYADGEKERMRVAKAVLLSMWAYVDPRTPAEAALDEWQADSKQTREADRP